MLSKNIIQNKKIKIMKTTYIFILIVIGLLAVMPSCKEDSKTETVPQETTAFTPGQTLTYSFAVDDDTVVKMIDEAIDFGTQDRQVIMLIHKQTDVMTPGYEYIFFPVIREKLGLFMILWAGHFDLNFVTQEERAAVYGHFLDFVVLNGLDAGLLIELIIGEGQALSPVISMIDEAENLKNGSDSNLPSPNDLLYRILTEKITPGEIISELKASGALKETTSGVIVTIFKSLIKTIDVWVDFTKDNKPITDMSSNFMCFLNTNDTVLSHYTGGTAFLTKTYSLSYDAGLIEAKCKYHLEGVYAAVHNTIPGFYIPSCNTICPWTSCKGAGFVVKGKTDYSPAINSATNFSDPPVADMNGKVSVEYGDCCCFRKFSYLNFKINAGTGYSEVSWSPGKR